MECTSRARICDLSNEVLLSIFSFLPITDLAQCAATCEKWRGIVTGFTRLWKAKEYRSYRSPRECPVTRAVLHALPPFQEVTMESENGFMVMVSHPRLNLSLKYIGVLKDCPRLRCQYLSARLDISGDILSSESTVDFQGLQHLEILRISSLNFWSPRIYSTEYVVRAAMSLCPKLTRLSVCTDFMSAESLDAVENLSRLQALEMVCPGLRTLSFLRHCSDGLEELQLADCTGLPSPEFAHLRLLRNLRKLWLSDCRFEAGDLEAAVAGLAGLESLQLDCCSLISDLSILRRCARLRELCITNSPVPDTLPTVRPVGCHPRLDGMQLPTGVEVRSLRAVGLTLTAEDLQTALLTLEERGLSSSCLAYLGPLRRCSQLRHLCCEFVQGPGARQQLNVRVHVTLTSSTQN